MSRAARYWLVVAAALGLLAVAFWLLRVDTKRFRIPSEAMVPTLEVDDRITVNRDAYDDAEPQVGDIVVFHPPEGAVSGGARCGAPVDPDELCPEPVEGAAEVFFVKRIVARPGDRLRVVGGTPVVNGRRPRRRLLDRRAAVREDPRPRVGPA